MEPPKKPEQAPFFLPTLPGVEHRFAIEEKKEEKTDKKTRLDKSMAESKSILQAKLARIEKKDDCEHDYTFYAQILISSFVAGDDVFDYIKGLSPAAIDIELRSLVTLNHLRLFVHALKRRLQSHRDFEAVQALQNVFLRLHGDTLLENKELLSELEELLKIQEKESERVLELLASSLGILGFVREAI